VEEAIVSETELPDLHQGSERDQSDYILQFIVRNGTVTKIFQLCLSLMCAVLKMYRRNGWSFLDLMVPVMLSGF
jgi:hypothetical protein